MSAKKQPKPVIRYRVRKGARFTKITHDFDMAGVDGVLAITSDEALADTFPNAYIAKLAIMRTERVQAWVKGSTLASWAKFKPLLEVTDLTIEPVEIGARVPAAA